MEPRPARPGTQSIERALRLLKLIASPRGHRGWRFSDLAERCGLEKGTAHRLLTFLAQQRLVERPADSRRYLPGPLLFELSLTMTPYFSFLAAAGPAVERLAKRSGGLAHLLLRSGSEFVCALHAGNSTLIKAPSIEIGTRRPLLLAAGGIAMLGALEEEEAERIADENVRDAASFGSRRLEVLRNLVHDSRRRGFCAIQGEYVKGIHVVGVPVLDARRAPIASLSVLAPAEVLSPGRLKLAAGWLKAEATQLGEEAGRVGLLATR